MLRWKFVFTETKIATESNDMPLDTNLRILTYLKERDILFQMCFFFIKPDTLTKISLKRVRLVMINDFR